MTQNAKDSIRYILPAGFKWLITGGCGFVGTNLVNSILAKTDRPSIRIVDSLETHSPGQLAQIQPLHALDPSNIPPCGTTPHPLEIVRADIRDTDKALAATVGADIIVHLAANTGVQFSIQNPRLNTELNINGTLNYIEAARINRIPRLIFASSCAPMGDVPPPIDEETPCHPISPYGASKLAGEALCSSYAASFNLMATALRFSNIYGPLSSHKSSIVARLITQALQQKPWVINGDGTQTRDFIFSEDIADAIIATAACPKPAVLYQLGTQQPTSVRRLVDQLEEILYEEAQCSVTKTFGPSLVGDCQASYANITKAKQELGWCPKHSLKMGLRKTVQWFLHSHACT